MYMSGVTYRMVVFYARICVTCRKVSFIRKGMFYVTSFNV